MRQAYRPAVHNLNKLDTVQIPEELFFSYNNLLIRRVSYGIRRNNRLLVTLRIHYSHCDAWHNIHLLKARKPLSIAWIDGCLLFVYYNLLFIDNRF